MTGHSTPDIRFVRLPEIPLAEILAQMTDPRVTAHLPLLKTPWDRAAVADFVARKEACWQRDGLGHWAILTDGQYAGWGGFQKEGEDWDFGLVLTAAAFGTGPQITARALAFARADPRLAYVTFLLPPSRRHFGALTRLGAHLIGEVFQGDVRFLKFRLETGGGTAADLRA